MGTFDGRQLTAARALAELTVTQLASAAGVTRRTVHRLEIGGTVHVADKLRHGQVSRDVWNKIVEALAGHGIVLVPENGDRGAGVRWTCPRSERRLQQAALPQV
jgi:helix-turn-helix protein